MNREEYLELLKDYLLKVFSKDETNDILRDYEEYFVDAILEGKSENEIIMSLGSPKKIVKDLIDSNLDSEEKTENLFKNNIEDKYDKIYKEEDPYFVDKVGETCQKGFKVLKRETSHLGKKIKKSDFFNRVGKKIDKKFTVDIDDIENKEIGKMKKSSKIIQICLKLMSLFLVFPAMGFVGTIVGFVVFLVGMAISYIVLVPVVIKIFGVLDMGFAGVVFSAIFAIGAEILAFMVVIFFVKLFISLLKIYINWLKRKNIYINAANKYEGKCDIEYEDEYEDEYDCDEFEIDEKKLDKNIDKEEK